mgnify:CR=1 FL=1
MTPSDYTWMIALGGLLLTAAGVFAGWVLRIYKGEAAAETARQAMLKAEAADERAHVAMAELAAFKTEVARDYASLKTVEQVENRVVSAVDGLGIRLDRLVEILITPGATPGRARPPRKPG